VQDLLKQGYQGRNIVLLGDSAGGGMVPALAIQLQREGVALPAALGMFSPYADVRSRGDTMRTMIAVDPVLPGAADCTGMPMMGSEWARFYGPDTGHLLG
jgi:acetyl esterase/lipase